MVLRDKAPVPRIGRIMTVISHHKVIVHFEGIGVGCLIINVYGPSLNTQIIIFKDKPEAVATLAQVFGVKSQNVIVRLDPNQAVDLQVILGADYDPCQ